MSITLVPRQTLLAGAFALTAGLAGFTPNIAFATERQPVAILEQAQGDVVVEREGQIDKIASGQPLHRFDRLITRADARAALAFGDGSRLVLGENSIISIEDWRPERGRSGGALLLDLEAGSARLTAAKPRKAPDKRVELRTPAAVVSMRGTDVWSGPIDGAYGVIVLAGAIDVRNDAGSVVLDRRHTGTMLRDRSTAPERPRGFAPDQIQKAMMTVDLGLK